MTRVVRGFQQRRRVFPIGLLAGLVCAAVWLVAVGTSAEAQGVSGYTEVTGAAVTVPGFTSATGSATCPTGDVVLSGGYTLSGGNMVIDTAAPLGANGAISSTTWTVTGFDNGDGQGSFTPYAICVSSSIAGYSEASKAQSANAGSFAQLTETCPAGSVITGGGFAAGSAAPVINESDPTSSSNVSSTTWTVFVDNSGSRTAQSVTTYVLCVSNTISGYSEQLAQNSKAGVVSATCPSGSLVIGGGVFAPGPPNTLVDAPVVQNAAGAFVVSNTSWSVAAASTGGGVIGSIAICAAPAPTVNSLKPSNGPAAGGNTIAVVGNNFTGATAVNFGSTPTSFSVVSSGQINAVVPAGSGAVDVTVTTPGGTSPTVSGDIYKYVPSVTSVSPTSGPTTGATTVTISGTGFTGATGVSFGGAAATFVVKSSSQISATAPAGATGTVDITVTTPGGTSATSTNDHYTYVTPPTVTRVSPSSGPAAGGTSVTIAGTNFTGATAVNFGGIAASSYTVTSAASITATSPAGSGAVDVTVTIPGGGTSTTNSSDVFKYVPSVTSVNPASGPTAGGTSVTINGAGFSGATAVNFGGTAAGTYTVNSSSKITATAPAESAGIVDITVTTTGGTSATNAADHYTYTNGPTVTAVVPAAGPTAGGNTVTIIGTNLTGATAVKFGATAGTNVVVVSATQITATAPAEKAGTVDITVTTPGGTSATSAADQYTYAAVPTVSSVNPAAGPTAGGNTVTISGTNLTGATAVKFGATAGTNVVVASPTQVTATAPAGTGVVHVSVTTPGGTSAGSGGDQYAYQAPPTAMIIAPADNQTYALNQAVATAFACSEGANGPGIQTCRDQNAAASGAGSLDTTNAGPHTYTVTATSQDSEEGMATIHYTVTAPPPPPLPGAPAVTGGAPTSQTVSGASVAGSVNPEGILTQAFFEYGIDLSQRGPGATTTLYDQQTPPQQVGSDTAAHAVTAPLTGLVPGALYHVRLVATNAAGTTFGQDQTFTTAQAAAPPPPVLGQSQDVKPVSGKVFIKNAAGQFVPLTGATQIPSGTVIDALNGTLNITTAVPGGTGGARDAAAKGKKRKPSGKTQSGNFGGAIFKLTQARNGLANLSLVEGAFNGAPTYATCKAHKAGEATAAAVSSKTLQLLHASAHGKFTTSGRYSAATVRGTTWTVADRCDGTLTHDITDSVAVTDFVRHKTIILHAGQSYLAAARNSGRLGS